MSFSLSYRKFLSNGHRAVLPRFKISKWDCKPIKKFVMRLHCVQIKRKLKSETGSTRIAIGLQAITRNCLFFKLFVTSLNFDSDGSQLVGKQCCRNSHETCYMKLCYVQGNWDNNCVMITLMVVVCITLRKDERHRSANARDLKFLLEILFDKM